MKWHHKAIAIAAQVKRPEYKFAERQISLSLIIYLSIEENLTETKQMLEEVVTLVYSYLSLPQHTDPHASSSHCILPKTSFHSVHIATECVHIARHHPAFLPLESVALEAAGMGIKRRYAPACIIIHQPLAATSCISRGVKFDECTVH